MRRVYSISFIVFSSLLFVSCKTKNDLRREQEVDRLRSEIKEVRGDRADIDTLGEELKVEITRMSNLLEDRAVQQKQQMDEVRKDVASLSNRMNALEQKIEATEAADRADRAERAEKQHQAEQRPKPSLELGKRQFEEGHYADAVETLRPIARAKKGEDSKKAQYLLAETHFAAKEYASAALEFSEFKKIYPKDPQVPLAIYRQANSFRNMNRTKEAKLFYQELVDRFPKNSYSAKAKQEMKRLK